MWSRDEVTEDRRGREIHGHRLVSRASVVKHAERVKQDAEDRRVADELVCSLRREGVPLREVAQRTGRSIGVVQRVVREAGL